MKTPDDDKTPAPMNPAPKAPESVAPPLPGHQTASPEEREKALQMAMEYHQGKTVDHTMVIGTAKAFLDFLHEKFAKA